MRLSLLAAVLLLLGGCVAPSPPPVAPPPTVLPVQSPAVAAENFLAVVSRVEPVAESYCRSFGVAQSCDFRIVLDDRPRQPPNAFQTEDRLGRPVLGFTVALIADARNQDEMAFVLGHEAAHHISGHIAKRREEEMAGALLAGVQAKSEGLSEDEIRAAVRRGAVVAATTYSRNSELEADALGAEIALVAGFDPNRGTGFFDRLPDPGDRFLGTHPPNAARKAVVAATVRRLTGS